MNDFGMLVYHYTSLDGLAGIIKSQKIWATHTSYLNDASELIYSRELIYSALDKLQEKNIAHNGDKKDLSLRAFIADIKELIDKLLPSKNFGIYVCSFSEQKDLLSQWRAYSQNGIGFSVGFSLERLIEGAGINPYDIGLCNYDEEDQLSKVEELVNKDFAKSILEAIDDLKRNSSDSKLKELTEKFIDKFLNLSVQMKHPDFAEEQEWRLITEASPKNGLSIRFRSKSSMLIPYVEIPLPKQDSKLEIDEIIIGPSNDHSLSRLSLDILLESCNVTCHSISNSTIPYRV